jgi:alpha-L-fucosidase
VIRLALEEKPCRQVVCIRDNAQLTRDNATPDYSYSCFDYYSNYRSTVAYNWLVDSRKPVKGVQLRYALSDAGRRVNLQVGDKTVEVTLGLDEPVELKGKVKVVSRESGRMRGGTFDRAVSLDGVEWTAVDTPEVKADVRPFSNYLMRVVLNAPKDCRVHLGLIAGNGVQLLVRDDITGDYVQVMKHLNPYRATAFSESVVLDLSKGDNEVILRSYNRFERELLMSLDVHDEQHEYVQTVIFEEPVPTCGNIPVRVSGADSCSEHTDCRLHNLKIDLLH